MTEQETREFARIERDLREIVERSIERVDDAHERIDDAHERIDGLIKFARWIITGFGGAGLAVALATIPWLWMLSSSTVMLQTTVAQHTETINARTDYLRRVDTLEGQVEIERTRSIEDRAANAAIVNEIRDALRSIERRLYDGGSMRRERPDRP